MAAVLPSREPEPEPKPELELIAVVAVHGIADQRRGETGLAVALQLAAASGGSVRSHDLPLEVRPLDAVLGYSRWQPVSWLERASKALQQSWRSDFLDPGLGGAPGSGAVGNCAAPPADDKGGADVGVRYTDYLLAKAQSVRDEAPVDAAQTANVSVSQVRAAALHADVFELHWADLSRLPGSVARIVAELFTLMFHLSRLGLDALSVADKLVDGAELVPLRGVQRSANWLFSRLLALLALQLVVCALVLAPALWLHAHLAGARAVVCVLVGVGVAAGAVYFARWRWLPALASGVVLALLLGWGLAWQDWGYLALMGIWLVLLSAAMVALLRYCELRFRAVFGVGLVLFALTLTGLVGFGLRADLLGKGLGAFTAPQAWVDGSLGTLEAVLLAHALLWAAFALLVAASVVLSEWALWQGRRARRDHAQTLVTARLGLFTSAGAFLVCQMAAFVLVSWALRGLLDDQGYTPWWFESGYGERMASVFVQERADGHAGSFALVALALLGLLGFVALVFAPSVLRELRLLGAPDATALGRWLSTGYRSVERVVRYWGWAVAPCAVLAAAALVLAQTRRLGWTTGEWIGSACLRQIEDGVAQLSTQWLGALVLTVAGGAAGLLALSKVAIKQVQAARAPLDAVLDIDNHFREFPRKNISRVRIVERYVALLDHLRQQGYRRVLIVAHSQGTVITAELLRYLQQRHLLGTPRKRQDASANQVDMQALRHWLDSADLRLLTLGCPLRQLYALRFPRLYPWAVAALGDPAHPQWTGPQPAELGLRHWSNLWGSGDYVGRWLWSARDDKGPQPLQVDESSYGGSTHEGHDAQGRGWKDRCLGADAHTHYFDLEQQDVAAELLALTRA